MKKTPNHTFPIVIAAISLLEIFKIIFHPFDVFGIASVAVGMTGIILFYKGNNKYDNFFYAWVFMQFPNIYLTNFAGIGTPIANAFPTSLLNINIGVGVNLGLREKSTLTIYLNLLPIGLYYLLRYLNVEKPIGSRITIGRLRKGTFAQIQLPVTGTIERIAGRNKISGIYLINLDSEITIKDKSYKYIMIDPKDSTLIQTNEERQVGGLRICNDSNQVFNEQQNPFIDWVTISTK